MIHRRLLQLAGAVPGVILLLAACGILLSALSIAFAFTLATLLTALIRDGGDPLPVLALLGGLAMARGVAIWGREILATRAGASVRIVLRQRLLARLVSVPAAERDAGETTTTVIDGVEGLDPYYTRYLPQLLVVAVVPAAVSILVWHRSATAGCVLAVATAIVVLAPRAWDARLLRNGRVRWVKLSRLSSGYIEALRHIPLLRAFGAGERYAAQFVRDAGELRDATMAQLRLSLVETAVSSLALHLGTVLATVAALFAVVSGSADAVAAMVVLMLARECFRPVQEVSNYWHAGYLGLSAVDGIDRILSAPVQKKGAHDHAAMRGTLDVSSLAYRYPGRATGLTGIALRVDVGETLAVIGPSGSGKSTLAAVMSAEIQAACGKVEVDGIDVRDYENTARARSIVVVRQDPVLFAWSVRDNLTLYRATAAEHEIVAAAQIADIHEVISALPDGYETVLAENGAQLSGGQRQRLALARALLSPAPILVLDEVTSALDIETESRVIDAIAAANTRRTIIVIAHRESACRHATRWVAMRDGMIVSEGQGAPKSIDFFEG